MNKENAHLYLPLVQALADGKTIQFEFNGVWTDSANHAEFTWQYDSNQYRIKPEPRTFEMWLAPHGTMYPLSNEKHETWERITVQEVLK